MKNILFLLVLFSSFSLFAQEYTLRVTAVHIGVQDESGRPTLCLSFLENPEGEVFGLLEDIHDCFYAREALNSTQGEITLHTRYLTLMDPARLLNHLQTQYPSIEFYFSSGE